LSLTKKLDQT